MAWIVHNSSGNQNSVQAKSLLVEAVEFMESGSNSDHVKLNHFIARKNPTRTIKYKKETSDTIQNLVKRSEMESDEDQENTNLDGKSSRKPTRTRQLSFAPEKIIDYKAKNI